MRGISSSRWRARVLGRVTASDAVASGLIQGTFYLLSDVRFGSGSVFLVAVYVTRPKPLKSNAQRD